MLSNTSNATWISTVYNQEAGQSDWNAYQLSLAGNSQKFSLVPGQSTTTSLVTYDGFNISSGQGMLLSSDGSSVVSGNSGVVTTTSPTFPTPTAGTASTITAAFNSSIIAGFGSYLKPDGTKLWLYFNTNIIEYTLSTPFAINTAVANGRSIVNVGTNVIGAGLCFSPDGRFLYAGTGNVETNIYIYPLAVAWDITTAALRQLYTVPMGAGAGYRSRTTQLQISPDGTRLIISDNTRSTNGPIIDVLSLPTPFDLTNASLLYNSTNSVWSAITGVTYSSTGGFALGVLFAPDGRSGINVSVDVGAGLIVAAGFTCSTPWNSNTAVKIGSTFTITSGAGARVGSAVLGVNGTYLGTLQTQATSGTTINTYNTTVDINTKYNVNIASFGLSSAPTQAYYAAPSVSVDIDSQANRVSMYPYQLDFTSATTTQAIVNAYGNASGGVLQTGDSILLNGTTSVVTTSVTQGAVNGVTSRFLGRGINGISYSNKFASIGAICNGLRFTPDGSSFICTPQSGTYNQCVIQFGLSTPWDVSTSYGIIGLFKPSASSFSISSLSGCEFNNTGSRLILSGFGSGGATAYEYGLSQNYQISSVSSFIGSALLISSASLQYAVGGRFNLTGTQYYAVCVNAATTSHGFVVLPCVTPFSVIGTTPGTTYLSGAGIIGSKPSVLEPNGNFIVCSDNFLGEQTISSNNDMTTITNAGTISTADASFQIQTNSLIAGSSPFYGQDFSVDGTKYYGISATGTIYQFNVRTLPLTQYTCNYATQPSAPTSVFLPDRSVSQSITASLSGGNMNLSAPLVYASGRSIAMKITSPFKNTDITSAGLSLYRSS